MSKNHFARRGRFLGAVLIIITITSAIMYVCSSRALAAGGTSYYRIINDNGIHYLPDEGAPDGRLVLFCMNNRRNWPHSIPGHITDEQVPSYVDGYLTAADFDSEAEYREFMKRLSAILYAGYPHNAAGLYQIREGGYTMTEADFDVLLTVPNRLRSDFSSSLGDATFSYSDYTNGNTASLSRLQNFLVEVGGLFPDGRTASGLSYSDITAMPFYKAAFCMYSASAEQTPLEVFSAMYGGLYYLTREQAYNATQNAVWKLLASYGIEDNNLTDISSTPFGEILLEASKHISPLAAEPSASEVRIQADGNDYTLRYYAGDGRWYSRAMRISEDASYNGKYYFSSLPAGISVITECGRDYVRPGELFIFSSNHRLETDETIGITSSIKWLSEVKQYSPALTEAGEEATADGRKFQHMAGAEVYAKSLSFSITLSGDPSDPSDPSGPGDPSDPDDPGDPSDPGDPGDPSDPGDSGSPGGSSGSGSSDSGATDGSTGSNHGGTADGASDSGRGPETGDSSLIDWYIGAAALSIGGLAAARKLMKNIVS